MINFTRYSDDETQNSTAYESDRHEVLLNIEEMGDPKELPYADKNGIATIGIGFNLRERENLNAVVDALGFNRSDAKEQGYIDQVRAIVSADYTGQTDQLRNDLNAVMEARASDASDTTPNKRPTFSFNSESEIEEVFDTIALRYEDIVNNWLANIPDSKERTALLSLAWNLPALLGDHLHDAIVDGDRAEAWYEIRYNSNLGSLTTQDPTDGHNGTAKRRYYESQLFGLYDAGVDETNIAAADATAIYQMYTRHRSDVLQYEARYGEGSTTSNMEVAANVDYGLTGTDQVQGLRSSLLMASDYLTNAYVTDAGVNLTIDALDIQVGGTAEDILQVTDRTNYTLGGNSVNGLLVGGSGNDQLYGQGGQDVLYGEADADRLDGGGGADYLFGGDGVDTYLAADGDTLEDTDGAGRVLFGDTLLIGATNDGAGNYIGLDGETYALSGDTLTVTKGTESIVINNFANGDLGINLADGNPQPPANVISGTGFDDQDGDGDDAHNALHGTGGNDTINGLNGDDDLIAAAGNDFLYGDDGTDFLAGEDGNDSLFSGLGHDILRGGNDQDTLTAGDDGVALSGGAGDDSLLGGGGADYMTGGADSDTLIGGAGNDVVDGDDDGTPVVRDWSFSLVMGPPPFYIGTPFQVPRGVDVPTGDFVSSGHDDSQPPPAGDVADTLLGGSGSDLVTGWGGDDSLFGGDNNDSLFGGWGDDVADGGSGSDYLAGWKGNDLLMGSTDRDVIIAGPDDDEIYGGGGVDLLSGDDIGDLTETGSDYLDGGSEGDYLDGGPGSDVLRGGTGNDSLLGGSGDDAYLLSVGDGVDTLIDSDGVNTVKFGGSISYDHISARLVADQNGTIYLQVQYDPTEAVNIQNGHVGTVQNFEFADGSTVSYQQVMEDNGIAQPSMLDLFGDEDAGYSALTSPAIPVEAVETVNFTGISQSGRAPSSDRWTSMHGRLDRHLAISRDGALGGDWDEKPGQAFDLAANGSLVDNGINPALYDGMREFQLHRFGNAHGGLIRLK